MCAKNILFLTRNHQVFFLIIVSCTNCRPLLFTVVALEEESERDTRSVRSKGRSTSPASQGSLHDDHLSIRSNQGSYSDTRSKSRTGSRRRSISDSDTESVTSSSSSSSSSSSETAYTTTTTTTTAQRDRDEFYDDSRGPTITFKAIREKRVGRDSDPQKKTVSVESSSQDDGKEFVHGYEVGVF